MDTSLAERRAEYSVARLASLREEVATMVADLRLPGLTIFAAGSFARLEGSAHSDIDLWFLYHPTGRGLEERKAVEHEFFERLVALTASLGFEPFSNHGQYLQTHNTLDVLEKLGGREDDAHNHFTLRMLLLLESKPIFGDDEYLSVVRDIIDSYYRDFPSHQAKFQPWFLMNDIMRFWKTLLLNYENKRNQPEQERDIQRIKNFKLKFSRMTTCFAMLAVLGTFEAPVSREELFELVMLTPQQRLGEVAKKLPGTSPLVDSVLEDYYWFLDLTGRSTPDLASLFADSDDRRSMFDRANAYGGKMFSLLSSIDAEHGTTDNGLIRFLVI